MRMRRRGRRGLGPGVATVVAGLLTGGLLAASPASAAPVGTPGPPGIVVGWGNNGSGRATPPPGLSGVVAVSAGGTHSTALLGDGTVVQWGTVFSFPQGSQPATPPTGLAGVTAVADGQDFSLALKSDGTVVAWGSNGSGQSTPPAGLHGVTAIAAGANHGLALEGDGTVVGWGFSAQGQTSPPAGLTGVTAIAAGATHSLALKSDGTVVGWGDDSAGQSTPPTGLTGVTAVAAGGFASLALKSDGTVVGWGDPNLSPPSGLTGVTAIAVGSTSALAVLSDGTVVGWGDPGVSPPSGLDGVTAVAVSSAHALAVVTPPSVTNLPTAPVYGGSFTATVAGDHAGSGSVATSTPTICSVTGSTVTFDDTGTCTLVASRAGITGASQSLSVAAAPLTVTASSATVVAGDTVTITPSYAGLTHGDTAPATPPSCSTLAATTAGSFASSCSGAVDRHYAPTYVSGTVTVRPGPVTALAATSGDNQRAAASGKFASALVATATDAYGNAVAGVPVTFTATSAYFPTGTVVSATTDSRGRAASPKLAAASYGPVTVAATTPGATGASFTLVAARIGQERADLAVAVSVPATIPRSTTGTVTVTVTDRGPGASGAYLLAIPVPRGWSAIDPVSGAIVTNDVVTLRGNTLTPGQTATFVITVRAPSTRLLGQFTASVVGQSIDPTPANNTKRANTHST